MRTERPHVMSFRVTEAEREAIRKAAADYRRTDSEMIRIACLGVAEALQTKSAPAPKDRPDAR